MYTVLQLLLFTTLATNLVQLYQWILSLFGLILYTVLGYILRCELTYVVHLLIISCEMNRKLVTFPYWS